MRNVLKNGLQQEVRVLCAEEITKNDIQMNIIYENNKMIIPIRCFTCGKVVGNKWDKYLELVKVCKMEEVFQQLGLARYCCRRMLLTHVNLIDKLLLQPQLPKEQKN